VLANCIAPGFIETELTRQNMTAAELKQLCSQLPAGRLGRPDEVAALAVWLAGPENTYVTGQNILIDGGFTSV
jgi:3-oxoacyl-[acyl-carrier protein] reductase